MLKVLYTTPADSLEPGDYVRIRTTEDDDYVEGSVLSVSDGDDTVTITVSSESDYGDSREVDVKWDERIDVLAQDYDGVEV